MLIIYRAFSWTYTAEELKKVLITQMDDTLSRTLAVTEKTLKASDDPDRPEMLELFESLKLIRENLVAGKASSHEWSEFVDWSWQTHDLESGDGGSYGKATYYAKATSELEIPAGKTKILIDREKLHLDLDIDIIV